jgi:hypothetical protein
MKLFVEYKGKKILLKNYTSYLSLDKTLSSFESKESLMNRLGLDLEQDNIYIEDNNGKEMEFNPNVLRTVLSFYEQGRGEDFVKWIYSGISDPNYGWKNKGKLTHYFCERQLDFIKDIPEKDFDVNNINNQEGKRLYSLIKKIKESLIIYDVIPATFETFKFEIIPDLDKYIRKNDSYDYAYMRKFIMSLVSDFNYELKEPEISLRDINSHEQEKIIKDLETKIHNYIYSKNQITLDELSNEEVIPMYDEDGIKLDEKEFLEEFNTKKIHL